MLVIVYVRLFWSAVLCYGLRMSPLFWNGRFPSLGRNHVEHIHNYTLVSFKYYLNLLWIPRNVLYLQ